MDSCTKLVRDAGLNSEAFIDGIAYMNKGENIRGAVISFKTADDILQCKYIGVIAAKDNKPRYFTAENDVMEANKWFLCEVTESDRGTIGFFDKKDEQTDLQKFVNIAVEAYEKDTSAVISTSKN